MPKIKTHSGARKRFKKLKNGAIKYTISGRRHLLTRKSSKRKRLMRRSAFIATVDMGHLKALV
jgi:large subunit ribosomal protein L35